MKKILTQYGVCALRSLDGDVGAGADPAPERRSVTVSNGCPEMMVVQQGRFTMGAPAGKKRARIYPMNFAEARYRSI